MKKQGPRRKVRKRKSNVQNSRVKFGAFLGIILLAVLLGYLTARFAIGPLIGYNADESPAKAADEEKTQNSTASADADTENGFVPTEGYALQFGAFSTEEAAEKLAASLQLQGIHTDIIKVNDVFKVISPVLDTKEAALEALSALPEISVEDVFIASF